MNSWRLSKGIPMWPAVTLLACAAAMAQMPGNGGQMQPGQQGPPSQQSPMPGQPNGPAGQQPSVPDTQEEMQANTDQAFVLKTLEDNQAEVQMGQLAAQKSPSDDLKQFGEKIARIHEQLSEQFKPVAAKLGVNEPKEPTKKDKQEIAKLQTLSGAEFDAAFIRAMMREQQTDVKGFKSEAESAQDPGVHQLAQVDAPVLSQHLQVLEHLAETHNVTLESKN